YELLLLYISSGLSNSTRRHSIGHHPLHEPRSSFRVVSVKQKTNRDMVTDNRRKQGHWCGEASSREDAEMQTAGCHWQDASYLRIQILFVSEHRSR
ncbi:hypothetical protein IRJ41_024860, partial [Triplophysa rosa]